MRPLWRAVACLRRLRRSESGQGLVEMALVAPILLLLILGTVDMARAWNAYQVITDAAREGTRNVVVDDPTITMDSVRTVVENAMGRAGLDPTSATITISGYGAGRGNPASVQIDLPYTFTWIAPFMNWVGGTETITLNTLIVMRNE